MPITTSGEKGMQRGNYELQRIEQGLSSLVAETGFIFRIDSKTEHVKALNLMAQLIEDDEKHGPLIDLLRVSIKNTRIMRTNFLHLTNVYQKSIQVFQL